MKRFSAVLALAALGVTTVALAQQSPPPADPPANTAPPSSTAPQDQSPEPTTPPADTGANTNSESRQDSLMRECMTQVTAANPGVPANDVKNFCDKEVNQATQPHN